MGSGHKLQCFCGESPPADQRDLEEGAQPPDKATPLTTIFCLVIGFRCRVDPVAIFSCPRAQGFKWLA